MWWWYTVIYKCQMSLESLHDKSMQAKSLTTPHPHLYDWVHWSERTCPRHEKKQSYQFQLNGREDSLLPWEMSHRSEESGSRTKASQIVLHHQENWGWKRDTHSEGKQEKAQSQMNTLPRNRLKTNCLRLGYLLKFCVHKLQLSFPSLRLYSLPYKLSHESKILAIQKYLLQHCLWRRKSILNNMTPFLDIICVCRSHAEKAT